LRGRAFGSGFLCRQAGGRRAVSVFSRAVGKAGACEERGGFGASRPFLPARCGAGFFGAPALRALARGEGIRGLKSAIQAFSGLPCGPWGAFAGRFFGRVGCFFRLEAVFQKQGGLPGGAPAVSRRGSIGSGARLLFGSVLVREGGTTRCSSRPQKALRVFRRSHCAAGLAFSLAFKFWWELSCVQLSQVSSSLKTTENLYLVDPISLLFHKLYQMLFLPCA